MLNEKLCTTEEQKHIVDHIKNSNHRLKYIETKIIESKYKFRNHSVKITKCIDHVFSASLYHPFEKDKSFHVLFHSNCIHVFNGDVVAHYNFSHEDITSNALSYATLDELIDKLINSSIKNLFIFEEKVAYYDYLNYLDNTLDLKEDSDISIESNLIHNLKMHDIKNENDWNEFINKVNFAPENNNIITKLGLLINSEIIEHYVAINIVLSELTSCTKYKSFF